MKQTHKSKLKIARKIGGFNSSSWAKRKKAIEERVKKHQKKKKI